MSQVIFVHPDTLQDLIAAGVHPHEHYEFVAVGEIGSFESEFKFSHVADPMDWTLGETPTEIHERPLDRHAVHVAELRRLSGRRW